MHLLSLVLSIWCPGKVSVSDQHWLDCCSVGYKQQQLQDVLCLSMEAFGNGHKICHVKKTLLNTSEMGCRMRPELKRPHLLPL